MLDECRTDLVEIMVVHNDLIEFHPLTSPGNQERRAVTRGLAQCATAVLSAMQDRAPGMSDAEQKRIGLQVVHRLQG